MNYKKIYDDLIEHRKMMPIIDGDYYEKHHILPKSMGGIDEDDNLIFLSAEDHFMAHLLLARVFGGTQWHAANILSKSGRATRHSFKIIRENNSRLASERMTDKSVYEIIDVETGIIYKGDRRYLAEATNYSTKGIHRILCGGKLGSLCLNKLPFAYDKPAKYEIRDVTTGVLYTGNNRQLKKFCNISYPLLARILKGDREQNGRWLLNSKYENWCKWKNYCKFLKLDTGEIFNGNTDTLTQIYGISITAARMLVAGYPNPLRGIKFLQYNFVADISGNTGQKHTFYNDTNPLEPHMLRPNKYHKILKQI